MQYLGSNHPALFQFGPRNFEMFFGFFIIDYLSPADNIMEISEECMFWEHGIYLASDQLRVNSNIPFLILSIDIRVSIVLNSHNLMHGNRKNELERQYLQPGDFAGRNERNYK